MSKGRDLSNDRLGRAGSLRFNRIGVTEVYPFHLEGFVFSKVSLHRTGSLWARIVSLLPREFPNRDFRSSVFVTRIIRERRTIEFDRRQPIVERENELRSIGAIGKQ
jgi:hypothetical protein